MTCRQLSRTFKSGDVMSPAYQLSAMNADGSHVWLEPDEIFILIEYEVTSRQVRDYVRLQVVHAEHGFVQIDGYDIWIETAFVLHTADDESPLQRGKT